MHTSDPSLQSRLPIEDILLHFEDIREKITTLSEITPKFTFWAIKFWGYLSSCGNAFESVRYSLACVKF